MIVSLVTTNRSESNILSIESSHISYSLSTTKVFNQREILQAIGFIICLRRSHCLVCFATGIMRKTARRGSTGGIDTLEHSVNVTTPAKESSEKTTVAVDTEEDSRSLFGFSETCCHACGVDNTTIGGSLLQCAICKRAYYCGMKCFNEHLPIHQKFCQTSALEKGPEGHNRVTDSAPPLVAALQAVKPPPSSPVKQSFFDASCSESESESEAMAIQRARRRRGAKRDVPLATTDVTATNPPTTRALLACPPLKHSSVDNGNDELKTKLMSDRFVVANASLENIGAQHTSASKLVQRTKKAVVKQTFIDPYCTESESETEEMAIKRSERRRGAKRDAIWSTPIEPSYSVVSQSKRDFRVLYASCKQNKATKSTGNLMNVPSSLNRPGSCEGDVHEEKFNANRSFNIPSSKFHANLSLEIPSSLKRPGPRRIANLSNMVKSKSDRNLVYMPASPKELNRSGKIPSSPARPGSRESGKLSSMGTSKSDRNLVCIPASPKRPGPKDKKVKPTGRIIMSYIGTSSSESESDTETESMVARRSQRRLGTKRNDEHCGDKNITRVENSPRSIAEFENSEVNERVFNLARSDVDTKSKANRDENIHSNRSIECNEELREEQSNEEDIEVEERRKCCGGGNLDSTCASKETYAWKAPEWTKRQ